jgi:hypothetical protein
MIAAANPISEEEEWVRWGARFACFVVVISEIARIAPAVEYPLLVLSVSFHV